MNILGNGYVKLIESWGSEERIIQSARMSTNGSFKGWGPHRKCFNCDCKWRNNNDGTLSLWDSNSKPCKDCDNEPFLGGYSAFPGDEKLLKYLWDHKHCYDEETEVLTNRGFIKWPEVKEDDSLGQFDQVTNSLVYEKPKQLFNYKHNGRMYKIDHGGVDLLVTDNHKMFVKHKISIPKKNKQAWSDWSLVTANDLNHKSTIRYRKHAARLIKESIDLNQNLSFPKHKDSRALLRLIGFFIGDGFAGGTRKNGIEFHIKKSRKIKFLRQICIDVGWELAELQSNSFVVRGDGLREIFRSYFYDSNEEKYIPKFLHDLNSDDATALLDGLKASDGSIKRGTWEYTSTSKQVIETMQLIALHAGEVASIHHGNYLSRLMILSRMREPVINQGKINTSWIDNFNGNVYCAETRTGVLIVRRNNKIVLSGNSTPFEMAGMTVEIQAPLFVFRQIQRHRSFSYNEFSGRYAVMEDIYYIPDASRVRKQDPLNKQSTGLEALPQEVVEDFLIEIAAQQKLIQESYERFVSQGIPKELARINIPLSKMSRMRMSGNLRNWFGFLRLRLPGDVQEETRIVADACFDLIKPIFPRTSQFFIEETTKDS